MIVFLHGFLGTPEDWDQVAQHIHFPWKALTLPGHLKQPLDPKYLWQEIPEKALLVGYSLGGRLALQFGKKWSQKLGGIITLSAHPGLESDQKARKRRDNHWISILEKEGINPFITQWYNQPLFSSFSLADGERERRKRHNPQLLAEAMRRFSPAKLPNLWPHLKNFSCPLLFLFGEGDIEYQKVGRRLEQDCEVVWVPKASHPAHLEAPDYVAEIINRKCYELSCQQKSRVANR